MSERTSSQVSVEIPMNGATILRLNQPATFNALSSEMMDELQQHLDILQSTPDCRVIILAATGKAFSAGHDLRELRSKFDKGFYQSLFKQCSRLMLTLQAMPQPVIAQVQGLATAAGCQLVSMCDLALAAQSAQFAVSGINYGLFCSTPSVGLSRNISRKVALEMLLTGDFISAEEAQVNGLINRCVPDTELEIEVMKLCQKILRQPAVAVTMGKALFYRQIEMGVAAAYQLAGEVMACNMMDDMAQEGFQAFLEKRQPSWR